MHCALQKAESDWLIYNAPLDYAERILNGDLEMHGREKLLD
ncbi:MAG: DUF6061 family protein [Lachnospiraceae bacterium]